MTKQQLIQKTLLFPEILWKRPVHYYKSQGGRILVLAGSRGMTGAATLTCEAIFRSGTGILVLGFPEGIKKIYKDILPEAMTLALPETISQTLSKRAESIILDQAKAFDTAVIGPGLSQNSETIHLVWQLLFELSIPTVLDADGLHALAKGIEVIRSKETEEFLCDYFKKRKGCMVVTPHAGEALHLLKAMNLEELKSEKLTTNYIVQNKERLARLMSESLNMIVILKGHDTVIAEPNGRLTINKVGGPELATAGSGDVLSGIVGSFIGQNPKKLFEATCTAVYLHGLSGQIAKDKIGERSVIASDIIRYLPEAIKKAESEI